MEKIINDFYKSVIYDKRYMYILEGLKNTILIAIGAIILGMAIGLLVAFIRDKYDKTGKGKIANYIANLYVTIIRGTPALVQLMIIYYVIFGSVSINKILVAILAFGINSGAYVAEIFRSGIMSIDNGQFEAASSLGLSYKKTFIYRNSKSSISSICKRGRWCWGKYTSLER